MANFWRKPFDAEIKTPKPGKIIIEKEKCKGCGFCTEFCPRDALAMTQEINSKGYLLAAVTDESKCLSCGLCEIICPEFGVKVLNSEEKKDPVPEKA
ncbi:MAG TPA: 4Fe-4S binding protein [Dehalococcoidales bacterium]|nr:4Fe-4S binding protein [Dehalococcoidales bacterium]